MARSLNDYRSARDIRDIIKTIVQKQLDILRPLPKSATVQSVDRVAMRAVVLKENDTATSVVSFLADDGPYDEGDVVLVSSALGLQRIIKVTYSPTAPGGTYVKPALIGPIITDTDKFHAVGATGEPAFLNSWANTTGSGDPPAAFFKDSSGEVTVKGCVQSGVVGSATGIVFQLPAGYLPHDSVIFPATTSGGASLQCRVDTAGNVIVYSGTMTTYAAFRINYRAFA